MRKKEIKKKNFLKNRNGAFFVVSVLLALSYVQNSRQEEQTMAPFLEFHERHSVEKIIMEPEAFPLQVTESLANLSPEDLEEIPFLEERGVDKKNEETSLSTKKELVQDQKDKEIFTNPKKWVSDELYKEIENIANENFLMKEKEIREKALLHLEERSSQIVNLPLEKKVLVNQQIKTFREMFSYMNPDENASMIKRTEWKDESLGLRKYVTNLYQKVKKENLESDPYKKIETTYFLVQEQLKDHIYKKFEKIDLLDQILLQKELAKKVLIPLANQDLNLQMQKDFQSPKKGEALNSQQSILEKGRRVISKFPLEEQNYFVLSIENGPVLPVLIETNNFQKELIKSKRVGFKRGRSHF